MVYESTFNDALNQKQSSCEQAGGEIVKATVDLFLESEKELFTIEEVCKLRRSELAPSWNPYVEGEIGVGRSGISRFW